MCRQQLVDEHRLASTAFTARTRVSFKSDNEGKHWRSVFSRCSRALTALASSSLSRRV